MRVSLGAASAAEAAGALKVRVLVRTRFETPSRILSLRMRLYSRTSGDAAPPGSRKNSRLPTSSAGRGTLAIVSSTDEPAPK